MYLSNNLWIRLQLNQAFCEASGMCMIVRLPKYADRTSQGNLQMRGLELAMRKVGGEFQIARYVARILSCHSSSFQLDGHTKQIFSGSCYRFSPLQSKDETQSGKLLPPRRTHTHQLGLVVRGKDNKQQRLQHRAEGHLRLSEFIA